MECFRRWYDHTARFKSAVADFVRGDFRRRAAPRNERSTPTSAHSVHSLQWSGIRLHGHCPSARAYDGCAERSGYLPAVPPTSPVGAWVLRVWCIARPPCRRLSSCLAACLRPHRNSLRVHLRLGVEEWRSSTQLVQCGSPSARSFCGPSLGVPNVLRNQGLSWGRLLLGGIAFCSKELSDCLKHRAASRGAALQLKRGPLDW